MRCVYDDLYIVRLGNQHLLCHAAGQDFLIVGNFQQLLKGHFHVLSQYSGVDLLGIMFPRGVRNNILSVIQSGAVVLT